MSMRGIIAALVVAAVVAGTQALGQVVMYDSLGRMYTSPTTGDTNVVLKVEGGSVMPGTTNVTGSVTLAAASVAFVSSSCTVTLPAATGSGKTYVVKNIASSGNVTLDADGTDTVDGDTGKYFSPGTSITVVDGAAGKWYIIR